MKNFNDYLHEQLKDGEFAEEYNKLETEYSVLSQIIRLRKEKNLSQSKLAELVGTKQSNISRLESGEYNPTLDYLIKIADALDAELKIEFIEKKEKAYN